MKIAAPSRFAHSRTRPAILPGSVLPMLAKPSTLLPANEDQYSFEFKWDGIRAICHCEQGATRIFTRNRNEVTAVYPELAGLASAVGKPVVLDGEIVALDDNGRPSFPLLQQRMKLTNLSTIERTARRVSVYCFFFDILAIGGKSVMGIPLLERRELLESLQLADAAWDVSPAHVGKGRQLLQAATANELEGIVAKKIDSPYLPGLRTSDWLKVKLILRQEFVIGGWTPQTGTKETLGAIQIGYYDPAGRLRYAGSIDTGFTMATAREVLGRLNRVASPRNPFADVMPRTDVNFVRPKLVAEVEYRRWPADGLVHQGAFKGLRTDKDARQVVREDANFLAERPGNRR